MGIRKVEVKSKMTTSSNRKKKGLQPMVCDILCGKDKTCLTHEGSRRFRAFIESYQAPYDQAETKQDKMKITKEVFDRLINSSSRFLKYNDKADAWEIISSLAARDKISHALRNATKRIVRKDLKIEHHQNQNFQIESSRSSDVLEVSAKVSFDPIPFTIDASPSLVSEEEVISEKMIEKLMEPLPVYAPVDLSFLVEQQFEEF